MESWRWPTLADLEQALVHRDGLQAWDVLGGLPDGLVVALPGDISSSASESELIGLTVAGAAACDGARETLDALFGLVRTAAQLEPGPMKSLGSPAGRRLGVAVDEFARLAGVPAPVHTLMPC